MLYFRDCDPSMSVLQETLTEIASLRTSCPLWSLSTSAPSSNAAAAFALERMAPFLATRPGSRSAGPWHHPCNREVVIGPAESPFPPLYPSREPDWTWRLENRHVTLREVGLLMSDCTGAGAIVGEAPEFLPVLVDGEVFYVHPDDLESYQELGAVPVG